MNNNDRQYIFNIPIYATSVMACGTATPPPLPPGYKDWDDYDKKQKEKSMKEYEAIKARSKLEAEKRDKEQREYAKKYPWRCPECKKNLKCKHVCPYCGYDSRIIPESKQIGFVETLEVPIDTEYGYDPVLWDYKIFYTRRVIGVNKISNKKLYYQKILPTYEAEYEVLGVSFKREVENDTSD